MRISSLRITKQESSSQANWANTSNMHWCFGATIARPAGMCSRPRSSTRMSQIRRSCTKMPRVQNLKAASVQRRGQTISGRQPITSTADHR